MTQWARTFWGLLATMVVIVFVFGDPVLFPIGADSGSFLHVFFGAEATNNTETETISGQTTSEGTSTARAPDVVPSGTCSAENSPAYYYERREMEIGGKPQSIHLLTVDPSSIDVHPVLSYDRLFGFEPMSEIDARYEAVASVNGWFSHSDGNPAAMVFLSGRSWHSELNYGASIVLKENEALLTEAHTWSHLMRLPLNSEDTTHQYAQPIVLPPGATFRVNPWPMPIGFAFYTSDFGTTDRSDEKRLVGVVENGELRGFLHTDKPVEIPASGFLVSARGSAAEEFLTAQLEPGDQLRMRTNLSYGSGADQIVLYDAEAQIMDNGGNAVSRDLLPDVVELGGWLVRDGKNVAASYDRYVGTMETRAPRTAVGMLNNGYMLFLVADGRQGESGVGLTGKELADLLISIGAIDAALLDGGGNSQMIVAGQTVNSPSTGRERPMAFAFVLTDRD